MLKPKNISIKKVTQTVQPFTLQKNTRNSRKSLKMPKRDFSSQNPSPINIMKRTKNPNSNDYQHQQQQHENERTSNLDQSKCSQDHSNFIKYINGYLNQLDNDSRSRKEMRGSRNNNQQKSQEMEIIRKKINKEKEINRNMQKNIVQFQRILLQRTEKLDLLQEHMRKLEQKECNPKNSQKSKHRLIQNENINQLNSQFVASEPSDSENNQDQFSRYRQRRKTEMPNQIQKMISKTMALRPQKYSKQRI